MPLIGMQCSQLTLLSLGLSENDQSLLAGRQLWGEELCGDGLAMSPCTLKNYQKGELGRGDQTVLWIPLSIRHYGIPREGSGTREGNSQGKK